MLLLADINSEQRSAIENVLRGNLGGGCYTYAFMDDPLYSSLRNNNQIPQSLTLYDIKSRNAVLTHGALSTMDDLYMTTTEFRSVQRKLNISTVPAFLQAIITKRNLSTVVQALQLLGHQEIPVFVRYYIYEALRSIDDNVRRGYADSAWGGAMRLYSGIGVGKGTIDDTVRRYIYSDPQVSKQNLFSLILTHLYAWHIIRESYPSKDSYTLMFGASAGALLDKLKPDLNMAAELFVDNFTDADLALVADFIMCAKLTSPPTSDGRVVVLPEAVLSEQRLHVDIRVQLDYRPLSRGSAEKDDTVVDLYCFNTWVARYAESRAYWNGTANT